MPVTYYTETEFKTLKETTEQNINQLIHEIKNLRNEPCNMYGKRVVSCGECQFNGWSKTGAACTSKDKYFCK
jgi:hypothetical protein